MWVKLRAHLPSPLGNLETSIYSCREDAPGVQLCTVPRAPTCIHREPCTKTPGQTPPAAIPPHMDRCWAPRSSYSWPSDGKPADLSSRTYVEGHEGCGRHRWWQPEWRGPSATQTWAPAWPQAHESRRSSSLSCPVRNLDSGTCEIQTEVTSALDRRSHPEPGGFFRLQSLCHTVSSSGACPGFQWSCAARCPSFQCLVQEAAPCS